MGQKVHPYGFRLGYNKPWRSRWFAKQGYAKLLQEDLELKEGLRDRLHLGRRDTHFLELPVHPPRHRDREADGRGRRAAEDAFGAGAVPDGETIRCWLPYPREDHRRQTAVRLLSVPGEKYVIAPDSATHRTLYLEKKAVKGMPTVFIISYS